MYQLITQYWQKTGLVVKGVMLASLFTASSAAVAQSQANFPCHLKGVSDRVECGFLAVDESKGGASIDVHYGILPAIKNSYPEEAVLVIAGGPGQSAVENAAYFNRLLSGVRQQRDILIIDQRGTGKSRLLQCHMVASTDPLMMLDSGVDVKAETQACKEDLKTDLNHYTSLAALQDFEAVRKHLGYKKLHLFGVSYGTRMVQLYMKHYPKAIATATMDGVVPMAQNVLAVGTSVSRAVDLLFEQCEQQDHCEKHYPHLRDDYKNLLLSLDQTLIKAVKDPISGEGATLRLNSAKFNGIFRFALYSPQARMLLPYAIHQLSLGDSQPVLGLMSVGFGADDMALGMHAAIVCSEDWPRLSSEERVEISNSPIGDQMIKALDISCPVWELNPASGEFSQAVKSDIPSLLLSGHFDPATPPEWGTAAAKHLSNSRHIIAPYATHGVSSQTCAYQLIADLINGTPPKELDASCIEKGIERRFFVNANGAQAKSKTSANTEKKELSRD